MQADPSVEGIGFTLVEDDDIYGVDLDHVIDPATGAMLPFAAEIVALAETYCERSPSGTGLRMLARGKLGAAIKEDAANVEAYECWRYMTETGDKLDGAPDDIREAPQMLALLRKRVEEVRALQPPTKTKANGAHYSDDDLDTAALQNLDSWVRDLFGDKAKKTARGYRIPSRALGRDLQEDLSITPSGIVDFGVADMGDPTEGKRTPVTLIMEHRKCSRDEAVAWLCERLGRPVPERSAHVLINPTPWQWVEPQNIPKRAWVYGNYYLRRNISALLAPGGAGKSNLAIAEALAMASGQAILGISPVGSLNVWYWNGEDSTDELDRRIAAAAKHFDVRAQDINGHLFVDSGRATPITIAEDTRTGIRVAHPVAERMIAVLGEKHIDVLIVDPFISCHRVVENDNGAIDAVVKTWGRIAEVTNCAILLVHHVRKTGGEAVTVEDGRGASAFRDAVRISRTINTMTASEATGAGIDEKQRRRFFRTDLGKANFSAPAEVAEWYRLESVFLDNGGNELDSGDSVGVVVPWRYPQVVNLVATVADIKLAQLIMERREGLWRENARSKSEPWVGVAVAEAMQKDLNNAADKKAVEKLIKDWLDAGWLKRVERPDRDGRNRPYIEVGEDPE
ncbi:MAG: AAA family ATPase [Xanthobacteraceae bacterium]